MLFFLFFFSRSAMLDELDFRKEAENIESFNDFLDKAGITEAVAPKVCVCVWFRLLCVFASSFISRASAAYSCPPWG